MSLEYRGILDIVADNRRNIYVFKNLPQCFQILPPLRLRENYLVLITNEGPCDPSIHPHSTSSVEGNYSNVIIIKNDTAKIIINSS